MSLFGSIRMAANAMRASEVGLQVVGQNIANANTPGYIREEAVLTPSVSQRYGGLVLGTGVTVTAVIQKIDLFLEERLRGAVSDRASAETKETAYGELESLINELSDNDISTQLDNFFSSISDILNQPQSVSTRNLAVLQGDTLTTSIQYLAQRVQQLREAVNDRVVAIADGINRLTTQIADLNVRIANTEGGNVSQSDAVGLRDQRLTALEELAALTSIRVQEQTSGGVVVYAGGTYLVYEGLTREVEAVIDPNEGIGGVSIQVKETRAPLEASSGELNGLLQTRDVVLGGFADRLDEFAKTLIFQFNKIYASGQGLSGFSSATSEFAVDSAAKALNQTGLKFTPVNGSFQVITHIPETGLTTTHDIVVDLNGIGADMTLEDLAARLSAIPGLTARVNSEKKLEIKAASGQEFAFANDTSGVLAALGINTFFKGSGALDIGINATVAADPAKFAASRGGIGADTSNAIVLADFLDMPLASKNGATLAVLYDRLTGETTQAASISHSMAESARIFEETLRGQKMATSGVSLDEEAVQMIAYQRAYQASARYIAALTELFEILVSI